MGGGGENEAEGEGENRAYVEGSKDINWKVLHMKSHCT